MKKVAVLGVGPAGLMAAHAASLFPNTFVSLFSQGSDSGPTKSKIGGAQFLHVAIPEINSPEPDAMLRYMSSGSPDGYREKVYGEEPVEFVSMSYIGNGPVPAWSLIRTYDELWDRLVNTERVNVVSINPIWLHELIESGIYDLIVSTVPRNVLCLAHAGLSEGRQHLFVSQPIRIMNRSTISELPDNNIVYDGTRNVSWYRTSKIFGVGSTEWGESAPDRLPYDDEIIKVRKPLRTDCSCFSDHVMFAGRYGEWRKGVLTHDAFKKVYKELEQ